MNKIKQMLIIMAGFFFLYSQSLFANNVQIGSTTYTTLKAAFDAINAGTHTGDIVVKIIGNTTESSTAVLNASGNGNASYNSVTIYPTGSYTISGSVSPALIELRGADNVTIDGRSNQSGTTRSLTLRNSSTGTVAVVWLDSLVSGTGGGARNNKIMWCNIEGGSTTATYGIAMGASTSITTAGAGIDNIEITNNRFIKMYMAVRNNGLSNAYNNNIKVNNNTFGSTTSGEQITYVGIWLYYVKDAEILNNLYESFTYNSTMYANYIYYADYLKLNNNEFRNFSNTSTTYFNLLYYSNYLEVKDNTIKNTSTSSAIYSYYVVSSPYGVFENNLIDNVKANGSVNYPFFFSSCTQTTVKKNTVKNIFSTSTIYGVYFATCPSSILNDNRFENVTSTGSVFYPLFLSSSGSSEVKNNYVKNVNILSTFYGVYLSSSTYCTVDNNYFENVTVNNSSGYAIYLTSSSYTNVYRTTMINLNCFNYAYGLYNASSTDCNIEENKFFELSGFGSGATGAWGIFITGGSNNRLVNNSIAYLRSTNFSTSATGTNPFGIQISSGTGIKVYFNSVYLNGTQINVGTSASTSAAFSITSTSVNNIDVRNNVFANTLQGLSGSKAYAIYLPGSGTLTNSTFNYNVYFAGGTQGVLGFYTGDRTTLSSWQSAISQDANSLNVDPIFNAYNLPAPLPGSTIVGKGVTISGISKDIMGENRSSTAPTPGAYEKAEDIQGPQISFTPLQTTTSTSNRTLVVTITDITGVNTSTNAPRLYYRKSTNTNTYNGNTSTTNGWKFATPTISGNTYTFTIDYSRLHSNGAVSVGDFIEYFVIAKDNATRGNMSVVGGSFSTMPNTTNLSASDFPFNSEYFYGIAQAISGTYNVGSGNTYTSLTSAGGLFETINKGVLTGNVTINITSDLDETGAFELNKLPQEGGNYSITIRPSDSKTRKIQGTFTGALIRLIGANNVTIDGSYDGSGRYLEFVNNATSGSRAVLMIGSGGTTIDGGKNITIQNCKFYCASNTSISIAILTSDAAVSTAPSTPSVNNLTIRNNEIFKVQYGMILRGTTAAPLQNLLVENNILGSDNSSDYIFQYGIDVQNAPNAMIRRNTIYNIINSTSSGMWGIQVGGTQTPGINIDGNHIYSLKYNGNGGWGSFGINILGGNAHVITNNMISDITTDRYSNTSTSWNPFGIRIASGSNHKILFNTINMYGSQGGTNTTASLTANILFTSLLTGMDIRGNVLHNSLEGVSGTNSYNIFLFTTSSITSAFSNLNNNMYSVSGAAGKVGGYGTAVPFIDATNLNAWRSMTGRDVNSVENKPSFVSDYDLHIQGTAIGNSNFMLARHFDVLTDKDGETRNATTYYGADEVNPIFAITKQTGISPNKAVHCLNESVTLSAEARITGYGDNVNRSGAPPITNQWFKDDAPVSGQTGTSFSINKLAFADIGKYYMRSTFMSQTLQTNDLNIQVQEPIAITKNLNSKIDVCNSNPLLELEVNATGTINGYQWEKLDPNTNQWKDIPGANQRIYTILLANPQAAMGKYRARIMGPGNCGPATIYSNTTEVEVTEPIKNFNVSVNFNPAAVCKGDDMEFFASAEGTIYGYQWQYNSGASFVNIPVEENPSARTPHLVIKNATPNNSGSYRCIIYGSKSCGNQFTPSQVINVTVFPYFEISEHPQEQIVCENEQVFLNVYAEGLIYGYQWYKDGSPISLQENKYARSQFLMIDKAKFENSGIYHCVLTIEDCQGVKQIPSRPAAVYVATGTKITRAPETQAAPLGATANFTLRAHVNGLPNGYALPVQWYKGGKPLVDDGRILGSKSDILSISNVQESDYGMDYSVEVIGKCGKVLVKDFGLVKVDVTITKQPISVTECEGKSAKFTVEANSSLGKDKIVYNWYFENKQLSNNDKYQGVNTPTLTVNKLDKKDEGEYYCKVHLVGTSAVSTSLPASLNVNLLPIITKNLPSDTTVKQGDMVILYINAKGAQDYRWYFKGQLINGANEDTYIIEEADETVAGQYYVEAVNSCGAVKSNVVNLIVQPKTTDLTFDNLYNYSISKPYPHPINSDAEIKFTVPTTTNVELSLYTIEGKKISTLFNGIANMGENLVRINTNEQKLVSGTYILVLTSNDKTISQIITIVK